VTRRGNDVTIAMRGSRDADGMMLALSKPGRFTLKAIDGKVFDGLLPVSRLVCDTHDCAGATLTLETAARGPFTLVEMRRGLPMTGADLLRARPDYAVPSGAGDQSLLTARIPLP
jgi:hypothetical protein